MSDTPKPSHEEGHTPGKVEVLEGSAGMIFTVGSPYGHGPMHTADMHSAGARLYGGFDEDPYGALLKEREALRDRCERAEKALALADTLVKNLKIARDADLCEAYHCPFDKEQCGEHYVEQSDGRTAEYDIDQIEKQIEAYDAAREALSADAPSSQPAERALVGDPAEQTWTPEQLDALRAVGGALKRWAGETLAERGTAPEGEAGPFRCGSHTHERREDSVEGAKEEA